MHVEHLILRLLCVVSGRRVSSFKCDNFVDGIILFVNILHVFNYFIYIYAGNV